MGKKLEQHRVEHELQERAAKAGALLVARGRVEPVTNPVQELLDVATEIKEFHAGLREILGEVDDIRYRGAGGEQLRAEFAAMERSLERRSKSLQDLVRLDLEHRLVKVSEANRAIVVESFAELMRLNGLDPNDEALRVQARAVLNAAAEREATALVVRPR